MSLTDGSRPDELMYIVSVFMFILPSHILLRVKGCRDIYAAGDIATFPYYKTGGNIRVEHWDVAMQQGRTAAKHMMGKMAPFDSIPFFWTMLLGKSIR